MLHCGAAIRTRIPKCGDPELIHLSEMILIGHVPLAAVYACELVMQGKAGRRRWWSLFAIDKVERLHLSSKVVRGSPTSAQIRSPLFVGRCG